MDQLTAVLENITKAKGLSTWWALIEKGRFCEVIVYRVSTEKLKLSHFTFVEGLGDWITSSLLNGRLGFVWYKDLTIVVNKKKMWNWEIFGYTKGNKQHLQAWVDSYRG